MRSVVTLTLDSGAAYELLVEDTERAEWLAAFVAGHDFVVPTLFRYELANLIRRALAQTALTEQGASRVLRQAIAMPAQELPFETLFRRTWELRGACTFFDASYVAVAEATGTALVTLDRRLSQSAGPRCQFVVPPGVI
jgi:predicted nucleic acid-binding protein